MFRNQENLLHESIEAPQDSVENNHDIKVDSSMDWNSICNDTGDINGLDFNDIGILELDDIKNLLDSRDNKLVANVPLKSVEGSKKISPTSLTPKSTSMVGNKVIQQTTISNATIITSRIPTILLSEVSEDYYNSDSSSMPSRHGAYVDDEHVSALLAKYLHEQQCLVSSGVEDSGELTRLLESMNEKPKSKRNVIAITLLYFFVVFVVFVVFCCFLLQFITFYLPLNVLAAIPQFTIYLNL